MTKPVQLTCTDDQFHALHEALDKTRRTSETVKVDRAALQALVIDHARLLQIVPYRGA